MSNKEKETKKITNYFNRVYKNDNTISYAWYNTDNFKLSGKGIKELEEYHKKRPYIRDIFVVNNIEQTRPQRTGGDMPEGFRPTSPVHRFHDVDVDNSFIFIVYNKDFAEKEMLEAFKCFPKKVNIIRINSGADKMFEELGYEKYDTGDELIYQRNNHEICFF